MKKFNFNYLILSSWCLFGVLVFTNKDVTININNKRPVEVNTESSTQKLIAEKESKRANVTEPTAKEAAYIKRFSKVAQVEMEKYGVPASIKLAQGLLESNAGQSSLATKANNHFGIKCFSKKCTKGHCMNKKDDSHKDFFRRYNSAWESYRAHSIFLKKNRYKHLFALGTKNYKDWAIGLKKAGYATDKNYHNKLIKKIESLNLDVFDKS